jgi:hypothetical protein
MSRKRLLTEANVFPIIRYRRKHMASSAKIPKSIIIDSDLNEYVVATKGDRQSDNSRITELLRLAVTQEINARLDAEAEAFYAEANKHRTGTLAFQEAALNTFSRD